MNDYNNFCEYVVKPAPHLKNRLLKLFLLSMYTLLTAAYIFIFWLVLRIWQPLILFPFIMYALINITWKYVLVEYEYIIEAGELSISKIYDGRARRTALTVGISDMTLITKLTDSSRQKLNSPDVTEVSDFSVSGEKEAYLALYADKKSGKKRAVIFNVNDEMRRILRLGNPSAFVARQVD
jgi:hypothetical protein